MMRIYLSYFLTPETPFYGGNGSFQVKTIRSMSRGDECNASHWSFPNHAGTHIDSPRHFVRNGKCIDDQSADFWIFIKSAIVDMSDIAPGTLLTPEMVENVMNNFYIDSDVELLLLKTGMGRYRSQEIYWRRGPIFHPELATYLRRKFLYLRAFGFDTISLSSWVDRGTGREAHRLFLSGDRPILLIEDMDLTQVSHGTLFNTVIVAPLLVGSADATPCTVIAEVDK